PADKFEGCIADQNAGQKSGFGDDLKPVADAKNLETLARLLRKVGHDRRTRRDRAASQVIAVGEAAGHDDKIDLRQFLFGMPNSNRLCPRHLGERAHHVVLAIDAGKDDNSGKWRRPHPSSISYFSITVLARSFWHMASTEALAVVRSPSGISSSMYFP